MEADKSSNQNLTLNLKIYLYSLATTPPPLSQSLLSTKPPPKMQIGQTNPTPFLTGTTGNHSKAVSIIDTQVIVYRIAGKERIGGLESRSSNQTKPDARYAPVKSKIIALMNNGFTVEPWLSVGMLWERGAWKLDGAKWHALMTIELRRKISVRARICFSQFSPL